MSDDGEFSAPVTYKKTRAPKNRKGKGKLRERTVQERLESRRDLLNESKYLASCRELLHDALRPKEKDVPACPPPTCVVCLGLGSIAESSKSQDQYLVLQSLTEELNQLVGPLTRPSTIFDPAFTDVDKTHFTSDQLEVLAEEHSLDFDGVTFLYMPHCPRSLFEALLKKNWTAERISKLVIFGNTLECYNDPTHPSASSSVKTPFIMNSLPLWRSIPLPPDKHHSFNDMALQWIPKDVAEAQTSDFWLAPLLEAVELGSNDGEGKK
ncbi:SRR1 family protein [Pseudohyphozyma bogoriensis]|nr:SRR1 family protein [Pseudohyphozyma bogoriensis]